ncbi:MAG: M20/M25/M40 family metallo-hydrolase [Bryobacterales bacterium]|nr:M20/M25/M40 family metallo-hydrolase [Bryobacterales bacterium]
MTIQRIHTAAWGTVEPPNTPTICRVELFWQAMPGESLEAIDREFSAWFEGMLAAHPGAFQVRPTLEFPIRWLPGSAIDPAQPVVKELGEAARLALGETPLVQGIEGPCDMFVFHEFGIPAVLWGATGANLHQPDEYVEIDSLVKAAKTLLLFVRCWCGEKGKD